MRNLAVNTHPSLTEAEIRRMPFGQVPPLPDSVFNAFEGD